MTDIIFHIGLPKCMSSTLQRSVFVNEDGYLGTKPGPHLEENFAKSLHECTPFGGRVTTNWKQVANWANRIRRLYPPTPKSESRLLLSNEVLASSNRLSDRPIVDFLARFSGDVWQEGRVKAVLVLRNQPARLASGYAQGSQSRFHPSQSDFERHIERFLQRRGHLLDYAAWVEGLQSALGKENVGVFLLEESRRISFWEELQRFCRLEYLDIDKMVEGGGTQNKRARSRDTWAISPFDPQFKAKVVVDKPLNLLWPKRFAQGARANVRETAISAFAGVYASRAKRLDPTQRCTGISLTPEVVRLVQENVGESNKRLASQLGKDIESLGYF